MADALAYFGDEETAETEKFIRMFDRFFDCMNVRSISEWKSKLKPDLQPYTCTDDCRLKVRGITFTFCLYMYFPFSHSGLRTALYEDCHTSQTFYKLRVLISTPFFVLLQQLVWHIATCILHGI